MTYIPRIQRNTIAKEHIKYLGVAFFSILVGYSLSNFGVEGFLLPSLLSLAILILIKPIYGLCLAVCLDLWLSYIDFYAVPPRNYLILYLFSVAVLIFVIQRRIELSKESKKILLIPTMLILWALIINHFQGVPLSESLYGISKRLLIPLMIGFCTVSFIKDRPNLKLFLGMMLLALSLSAFVGIMQFLDFGFFWRLREAIGISASTVVGQQILTRSRISGLAYFAIPLSYQLASIIPLVFGVILSKLIPASHRLFLWLSMVVMSLALFFSLTRSSIVGCFLGIVVVLYLSKFRFRIFRVFLISFAFAILVLSVSFLKERFTTLDYGIYAKPPQFLVGLKIFISHPLGIGLGRFEEYATEHYSSVSHLRASEAVLTSASHNQFLNTLVYLGLPGLVLLLVFYWMLFKYLNDHRGNCQDSIMRGINIGLVGSFVSYVVASSFHNAGPFVGDPFNWYLIGLVMVLSNLDLRREKLLCSQKEELRG
ncbi:MAG: O-antigen ligase family protein [Candidatus Hodarchaeota archaeon]